MCVFRYSITLTEFFRAKNHISQGKNILQNVNITIINKLKQILAISLYRLGKNVFGFHWHKRKYNNAKRSIPAYPTFVNDDPLDLHLWPVTSKINRVYSLNIINMSVKFDEEVHNSLVSISFTSLFLYMSIVTLNFDLYPPKSIEFILSRWLTCLPSSMKKHTTV